MELTPFCAEDAPKVEEWLSNKDLMYYMLPEKLAGGAYSFAVRSKGKLVGWAALLEPDYENSVIEYGVAVPDQKDTKLGALVTRKVLDFAFHILGFNTVCLRPLGSNVKPENDIRDRFGFTRERIEPNAVKRGNKYEDVVVFSMSRETFERRWS